MTQDEIIRMARKADVWTEETIFMADVLNEKVERFAALVAAHEREKFLNKLDGVSEKVIYETVKEAVLAEREACAKVCDDEIKSYMSKQYTTDPLGGYRERFAAEQCAAAIRARSEK